MIAYLTMFFNLIDRFTFLTFIQSMGENNNIFWGFGLARFGLSRVYCITKWARLILV